MGFDINRPYRTRDGRAAVAVLAPDCRLYGWSRNKFNEIVPGLWDVNGLVSTNGVPLPGDLINIPEKRTVTLWLTDYGNGVLSLNTSRKEADDHAAAMLPNYPRFACIEREITYEVGEGL